MTSPTYQRPVRTNKAAAVIRRLPLRLCPREAVAMTWSQRWLDCLFLHFPVPVDSLQRLVPPQVEVETFGGSAWVSYVLFRLKLRPTWLPFVPGLSALVELNIRTYVRHRGQSGICFLRILADNRLAIAAARLLTPLPYTHARLDYGPQQVLCEAAHQHRLALNYSPPTSFAALRPGTLDAWLLERYRLFIAGRHQTLLAADAAHPAWQAATLVPHSCKNTLVTDLGLAMDQPAAAHYSPGVSASFGEFHIVGRSAGPLNCRSVFANTAQHNAVP